MYDDQNVSPEVRETINETLRDTLSTDGWTRLYWDVVLENLHEDFDIETDLFELAQDAPCLVEMFQIGALTGKGVIRDEIRVTITEIIHSLVRIALGAEKGDEKASSQLTVLHKVAHPSNYELPATVIKNLADSYHMSPHLARGWSVRSLMLDLSYAVEPTRLDRSVLEGPIKLTTSNPQLIDPGLYEKAKGHIKRGMTLQGLAIAIYIKEMDKEGITLETSQIKADLRKLKEWESINLKKDSPHRLLLWNHAGRYPLASIPAIPIHSEGWKKLWRRGIKNRNSYPM